MTTPDTNFVLFNNLDSVYILELHKFEGKIYAHVDKLFVANSGSFLGVKDVSVGLPGVTYCDFEMESK